VKKKIPAIQYGIGPIGASIVKLLREKESIEIAGAIDNDPAKIGEDLGAAVGAAHAASDQHTPGAKRFVAFYTQY
jgi:hypothetical protein